VLVYAPDAAERVRELVRQERACCPFLTFDLAESIPAIQLTISAPEDARAVASLLFEQLVSAASPPEAT
jgi:hypothetical protein